MATTEEAAAACLCDEMNKAEGKAAQPGTLARATFAAGVALRLRFETPLHMKTGDLCKWAARSLGDDPAADSDAFVQLINTAADALAEQNVREALVLDPSLETLSDLPENNREHPDHDSSDRERAKELLQGVWADSEQVFRLCRIALAFHRQYPLAKRDSLVPAVVRELMAGAHFCPRLDTLQEKWAWVRATELASVEPMPIPRLAAYVELRDAWGQDGAREELMRYAREQHASGALPCANNKQMPERVSSMLGRGKWFPKLVALNEAWRSLDASSDGSSNEPGLAMSQRLRDHWGGQWAVRDLMRRAAACHRRVPMAEEDSLVPAIVRSYIAGMGVSHEPVDLERAWHVVRNEKVQATKATYGRPTLEEMPHPRSRGRGENGIAVVARDAPVSLAPVDETEDSW